MTALAPGFLEIKAREIVEFLLLETDQYSSSPLNPQKLLEFLNLRLRRWDFESVLPEQIRSRRLRALLSFAERLIAVDSNLYDLRAKFSVLHEIAHYVLPTHQQALYVCDEKGLGLRETCGNTFEFEANSLASDLLFKGELFTQEANSWNICARNINRLANQYQASREATARRFVEKNVRPVMLIVFKKRSPRDSLDTEAPLEWVSRYSVASERFKNEYFATANAALSAEEASKVVSTCRDFEQSTTIEQEIGEENEGVRRFRIELTYNQYNIFALLTPCE